MVAAQLSVVGVFILDESAATQRMQRNTKQTALENSCDLGQKAEEAHLAEYGATDGNTTAANTTEVLIGEVDVNAEAEVVEEATRQLCACSEACRNVTLELVNTSTGSWELEELDEVQRQHIQDCQMKCIDTWMDTGSTKEVLATLCVILFIVQAISANRAWRFMALPSGKGTDAGDLRDFKMWLRSIDMEM